MWKILPSTAEYFYKSKAGKDWTLRIMQRMYKKYQNKYYTPTGQRGKPTEVHITLDSCKEKILSKYFTGQILNIGYEFKGNILERKKARIIKFYPHHVLCLVDNCRECFTYADLNELTTYKKGEKQ